MLKLLGYATRKIWPTGTGIVNTYYFILKSTLLALRFTASELLSNGDMQMWHRITHGYGYRI